jgi:D-cysteine desulfhydrase
LACYLVLDRGVHPEKQGNLLLDELFGAYVQFVETADPAEAAAGMEALASGLEAEGRKPYIIPRGGSVPAGATGYAAMIPELTGQLQARGVTSCYLYLGTGSTGTHSGVLAGVTALDAPITVQGISVSRDKEQQEAKILTLTNQTLEYLGLNARVQPDAIRVDDSYRGPGYGIPTPETMEAVGIAALDEGLVLDPVYTGKALAGLIGHARTGAFRADDTVVFLHTGGAPALFAYHQEVAQSLALTQA